MVLAEFRLVHKKNLLESFSLAVRADSSLLFAHADDSAYRGKY